MKKVFAVVCILVSMYMVCYVFYDINHNVGIYSCLYSTLTQVVTVTKICITNITVIVLSLTLFKRRCY